MVTTDQPPHQDQRAQAGEQHWTGMPRVSLQPARAYQHNLWGRLPQLKSGRMSTELRTIKGEAGLMLLQLIDGDCNVQDMILNVQEAGWDDPKYI